MGTVHSPKAWLDTLAIQAEVGPQNVDILCHWNMKAMHKLYNRCFDGVELLLRMKVVRLLAYNWRSTGRGHIPRDPPNFNALPHVPGEDTNTWTI